MLPRFMGRGRPSCRRGIFALPPSSNGGGPDPPSTPSSPTPNSVGRLGLARDRWHATATPSSCSRSLRSGPGQPAGHTITIIDWDDTLLCTTFLEQSSRRSILQSLLAKIDHKDRRVVPSTVLRVLNRIEEVARRLLTEALQLGPTFIVTNSPQGWVRESAAKYMPSLLPLFDHVTVISARAHHEEQYPQQRSSWKKRAFLNIASGLEIAAYHDLLVIGDSEYEMDAADVVGCASPHLLIKAVKFKENPSAQDLLMEQELLLQNLPTFIESEKSLTITLERQRGGLPA